MEKPQKQERTNIDKPIFNEDMILSKIFEISPIGIMVLDESTNIVLTNADFVALTTLPETDVLQHRPGNALLCVHSSKDPQGCGHSTECQTCPVLNKIETLLENGGSLNGAELPLVLERDGKPQRVWLKLGAEPVEINGRPHLCVAVEDVSERKNSEHQLKERIKELNAFYALANIVERENISADKICQEFIKVLPDSWQYPEITNARIVIGEKEFLSNNFKASVWKQSAQIGSNGSLIGSIDIFYNEERPEEFEGPFLKEERILIDSLADQLEGIIKRKQIEIKVSEQLEELKRWYEATIDREDRIIELKMEVNKLLMDAGKQPRYESNE